MRPKAGRISRQDRADGPPAEHRLDWRLPPRQGLRLIGMPGYHEPGTPSGAAGAGFENLLTPGAKGMKRAIAKAK